MDLPRVVMCSLWRNDAERGLRGRALHLLSKSYPNIRWLWIVGDSSDDTYKQLVEVAALVQSHRRVDVIVHNTDIVGEDPVNRRRRLGETANAWLDNLHDEDDYCLIHESDIQSPSALVELLFDQVAAGRCPIAGWPILPINDTEAIFYDIWAYRQDGKMFENVPPFHACYNESEPFEVESVGTCWMFEAADARAGARFGAEACLTLCASLRAMGRHIWVDPKLVVLQPKSLWIPYDAR